MAKDAIVSDELAKKFETEKGLAQGGLITAGIGRQRPFETG